MFTVSDDQIEGTADRQTKVSPIDHYNLGKIPFSEFKMKLKGLFQGSMHVHVQVITFAHSIALFKKQSEACR